MIPVSALGVVTKTNTGHTTRVSKEEKSSRVGQNVYIHIMSIKSESSCKRILETAAIDYLWDFLVLGDLLERKGCGLLQAYHSSKEHQPRESLNRSRRSLSELLLDDIRPRAEYVGVQCQSNRLLWDAY